MSSDYVLAWLRAQRELSDLDEIEDVLEAGEAKAKGLLDEHWPSIAALADLIEAGEAGADIVREVWTSKQPHA